MTDVEYYNNHWKSIAFSEATITVRAPGLGEELQGSLLEYNNTGVFFVDSRWTVLESRKYKRAAARLKKYPLISEEVLNEEENGNTDESTYLFPELHCGRASQTRKSIRRTKKVED